MALSMSKLLSYSWMSQAAYRDFGVDSRAFEPALWADLEDPGKTGKDNRFAHGQSVTFTGPDGFALIDSVPNDPVGFAAVVFQSKTDNSYTFVVRGTEPYGWGILTDLGLADAIGVVGEGIARSQLISAYRYYKILTTPENQAVTYTAKELAQLEPLTK